MMQMRRRGVVSNIDSFDVTQKNILLLGVAETFDRSSGGRSTPVENRWPIA